MLVRPIEDKDLLNNEAVKMEDMSGGDPTETLINSSAS